MREESGAQVAVAGWLRTFRPKKRASWALERGCRQNEREPMSVASFHSPMRRRHGLWSELT